MSASNGSLDDVLPWSAALSAGGGGAGGARGGSGSGDASSAALPAGRVVVTDAVDAEGDFVLQHMIARSLCAGACHTALRRPLSGLQFAVVLLR